MPAIDPSDAAFVRELVYRRSAIMLDEAKSYLIESRLEQVVRAGVAASIADLVAQARMGRANADTQIVEAITTHETTFFRDVEPFEVLKKGLFAELQKVAGRRALTIWSAACSSGQEPYSLAMLLLEHFPALVQAGTRIVATDLSAQVLDKAKAARFRQLEVNRGLPASHLAKYFHREGTEWVLKDEVRALVSFRQLNLVGQWALPTRPDLIFMRNVLIYFDLHTKRSILEQARTVIDPCGALFLGAAETTINVHDGWERVAADKTAWYRVRR